MLINLKQILQIAEDKGNGILMFNGTGFDSIQAIIHAAEELKTPVIIAHAEVHNVYNDISLVGPAMLAVAKNANVPVCVHLDHGVTMEMIDKAIAIGFTSIMFDGSSLPFEENVRLTKIVVEKCHTKNISVEGEIGRLVTPEAGSSEKENKNLDPKDFYTRPEEAKKFVDATGVDALAIAFGTSHGFYKSAPVLDFDVIRNVRKAVNIPLVMHGGSGVSDEGFINAVKAGIRKINCYSYMSKAGYDAAKKVIEEGNTCYLHDVEFAAYKEMKKYVRHAIETCWYLK